MPDAEGILEPRSAKDMPEIKLSGEGKYIKGANSLDWGMRNRLSRLFKPDGHVLILPIDHGYFQGPTRCLERPGETIRQYHIIHLSHGCYNPLHLTGHDFASRRFDYDRHACGRWPAGSGRPDIGIHSGHRHADKSGCGW